MSKSAVLDQSHAIPLDMAKAGYAVVAFTSPGVKLPSARIHQTDALTILNGLEDIVSGVIGIAETDTPIFGHLPFVMLASPIADEPIDRVIVFGASKHQTRAAFTYLRILAESTVQASIQQMQMQAAMQRGPGLIVPRGSPA